MDTSAPDLWVASYIFRIFAENGIALTRLTAFALQKGVGFPIIGADGIGQGTAGWPSPLGLSPLPVNGAVPDLGCIVESATIDLENRISWGSIPRSLLRI